MLVFFGWQGTEYTAYWWIFRVFRDADQPEKDTLSTKIELLEVPLSFVAVERAGTAKAGKIVP